MVVDYLYPLKKQIRVIVFSVKLESIALPLERVIRSRIPCATRADSRKNCSIF